MLIRLELGKTISIPPDLLTVGKEYMSTILMHTYSFRPFIADVASYLVPPLQYKAFQPMFPGLLGYDGTIEAAADYEEVIRFHDRGGLIISAGQA